MVAVTVVIAIPISIPIAIPAIGRNAFKGHVSRNTVPRHYFAHALFHAALLITVVSLSILDPARVIAIKLALIVWRQPMSLRKARHCKCQQQSCNSKKLFHNVLLFK
jgi:hypothetical protein